MDEKDAVSPDSPILTLTSQSEDEQTVKSREAEDSSALFSFLKVSS
jgi:hypothetical protein